ncbi:hypothetical protein [Sandaracinus amylolyticus]|uniref:Uncharacterized protein n=1 Tax=Sandaracinus amylolyticus TaxID=927083 RepID=A0A0F6SHX8_9BACT|nr:hypothetical protein [Sandaracinus amylolyticus]AKF11219.1 hypothetical protein DB32_008368 [Sandaracinus amylolyticus]
MMYGLRNMGGLAVIAALATSTWVSAARAQTDAPAPSDERAVEAAPRDEAAPPDDAAPPDEAAPPENAAPLEAPTPDATTDDAPREPVDASEEQREGDAPLPDEPPDQAEAATRTLSTTMLPARPAFTFWRDGDDFIKPVIQLSAMLVAYLPHSDTTEGLAARVSTLALARFGLEGQLFGFVTFRSVFERNFGFSLARNGPVGTSVWEGTASLQARENYLRLSQWGLSLTGGIFPDPASLDFISSNVLDGFGMDPYVRDPLLVSGFAQGQGVMLRYGWEWLDFGLSYTGGNPLTTSLAFGFGGDVSSLGTLFTAPLRALANGIPGSDIHLNTITPSFTFSHEIVDLRLAAQLYFVDIDVTTDADASLFGYNLRATAQVKILGDMLRLNGTFAYRRNEQVEIPDVTIRSQRDYEGFVGAGGVDFTWEMLSVGAQYYFLTSSITDMSSLTNHYINVAATLWLMEPYVSIGARWSRSMAEATPMAPRVNATDSFIVSMRLLI